MRLGELARGKGAAGAFAALLAGAVLWPMRQNWRDTPRDGFPLSYYPMFSFVREDIERVVYLAGEDAQGRHRPLPYTLAGRGGLNQVRKHIRLAVVEGRAKRLCRQVARQVARSGDAFADIVTVHIVSARYELDPYFMGESKDPVRVRLRASAPVERDRGSAGARGVRGERSGALRPDGAARPTRRRPERIPADGAEARG